MKTIPEDQSLNSKQPTGFLYKFQSKVIWVDFFNQRRMSKSYTRSVCSAHRVCILLRRKS
jgi:hypothetical protein